MRIIGDTNIPFLSYRKIALTLSALAIVGGLAYQYLGPGLNLGIDFVGGTQVTLKFRDQPDLGILRESISDLTVGTPLIQRFDEVEKNEIMIRVENPADEEGDFTRPILELLHEDFNSGLGDRFDLNTQGSLALLGRLRRMVFSVLSMNSRTSKP
jgi:preprotein translocase subunit SecF